MNKQSAFTSISGWRAFRRRRRRASRTAVKRPRLSRACVSLSPSLSLPLSGCLSACASVMCATGASIERPESDPRRRHRVQNRPPPFERWREMRETRKSQHRGSSMERIPLYFIFCLIYRDQGLALAGNRNATKIGSQKGGATSESAETTFSTNLRQGNQNQWRYRR